MAEAHLRAVPLRRESQVYPSRPPAVRSDLVGRDNEVAATIEALTSGRRIVTLIGPGGVGKTRLAIEVAGRLGPSFAGAVLYVPLASVADPGLVPARIQAAAGWGDRGDERSHDVLVDGFAERDTLLVLDNLEQVADAAPALGTLVDACPRLTVLATSRVALRVAGEQTITVAPLEVPRPPDRAVRALAANDAVAMFVQTARRFDPGFGLTAASAGAVAEICVRLDGLPLAIELAAARLRMLTPAELLGLLGRHLDLLRSSDRDVEAHHRTLRAAIEWSYQLLAERDQRRFLALGAFAGGFDLQAAAEVTGDDVYDVLESLEQLTEHHLVRVVDGTTDTSRFDLLHTVREFAVAAAAAAGLEAVSRGAHADWCLGLAERMQPELVGPDPLPALDRLERERDNFRVGLDWLTTAAPPDDERALRLVAALWRFWWIRGHATEGRAEIDRVLARYGGESTSALGDVWHAAGELAEGQGDVEVAADWFERARALREDLGDRIGLARSWNSLGLVARARGDLDGAEQLHQQALGAFRELGELRQEAVSLNSLGAIAYFRGQLDRAAELWEETTAIARRAGDLGSVGLVLANLGAARHAQGRLDLALEAYDESLAVTRQIGDRSGLARALSNLGDALLDAGELARAEALLDEALELARAGQVQMLLAGIDHSLGRMRARTGDVAAAAELHAASLALFVDAQVAEGMASTVEHLAMLAAQHGEPETALRLFAAAACVRTREGSRPLGADAEGVPRWAAAAEAAVTPVAAEQARCRGAAWTSAELVTAAGQLARTLARSSEAPSAVPGDPLRTIGLTAREAQVARQLVARRTDQEIADELVIGLRTATTHVSAVLRKLGVSSRRDVPGALRAQGIDLPT